MMPAGRILLPGGDTLDWPNVRIVRPRWYRLEAEYALEWTARGWPRQRLVIPSGFECDMGSVPAIAEWYLGRELILPAALPHDFQYFHVGRHPPGSLFMLGLQGWQEQSPDPPWSRDMTDRFFARNLRFCDIRDDQRALAYRAVALGGWHPWRQHARARAREATLTENEHA
jgi:hypothetical protein